MTYNTTKEAGSELISDSTPEPTGILANIYKQYTDRKATRMNIKSKKKHQILKEVLKASFQAIAQYLSTNHHTKIFEITPRINIILHLEQK